MTPHRRGPYFAAVAVVGGAVVGGVALGAVAGDDAKNSGLTVASVRPTVARATPGANLTVVGGVRNSGRSVRAGRVTILMRKVPGGARKHVVARARIRRVTSNRVVRFRISGTIPRRLRPGTFSVLACVRSGTGPGSCRRARRRVKLLAPTGGPNWQPPPGDPGPSGTVFQTIHGFGGSARVFDDPHVFENFDPSTGRAATVLTEGQRNDVREALYRDLGLTRIRPVQPDTAVGAGIEPSNDNGDPMVTNPAAFNFGWKNLDAHVPNAEAARQRGVHTVFLSPLNRESWMGASAATDVKEYAEWLLAMVRRFAAQGGRLTHLSLVNEPSWNRNTMSGAFIRDVIKELGPRLAAEGLLVPFVVPDDVRASDATAKATTILSDPGARKYVGALATHLYDQSTSNVAGLSALAKKYGLPLWMTEFSTQALSTAGRPATPLEWAVLMHDLLAQYDVSAIDYMWGYFGQWDGAGTALITLNHDGSTYKGFTRNKPYYYFGQFSRFVRPGARRVAVSSSESSIKVTAYWRGAARTVVAINPGGSSVTTTLTAADLAGLNAMTPTRTSSSENWAEGAPVQVSGTSLTVTLPPGSVTTFVGTAAG